MTEEFKKSEAWKIVSSKNGYDKEGIPCGQILCRSEPDIFKVSKKFDPENLIIKDYNGDAIDG